MDTLVLRKTILLLLLTFLVLMLTAVPVRGAELYYSDPGQPYPLIDTQHHHRLGITARMVRVPDPVIYFDRKVVVDDLHRVYPPRVSYRMGAEITYVVPGSPANWCGLEVGDVILEINRTPIDSLADLRMAIDSSHYLRMLVRNVRNGENMTVVAHMH